MNTKFIERLKLGFGTTEDKAKQQQLEKQLGLKGKLDIGDIADIVGGSLPLIGAIFGGAGGTVLGTPVGGAAGAAIGAAAGESVKQAIGSAIGVRKGATMVGEALRPVITGATTLLGGKVIGVIGTKVIKPIVQKIGKALPEKLMSQIFQRAKDDMGQLLKTQTFVDLQKTNPELFNRYIQQGVIKAGKNKVIEVNPTLAQEVLERGLAGSDEAMTKYSFLKQFQLESEIRNILQGTKTRIAIPEKRAYVSLLKDLSGQFSKQGKGFFSNRVKDANEFVKKLSSTKEGKLDPMDALELRRFLDNMRNTGSFKLNVNLSAKQEAYKIAADRLRGKLAQIPEIGEKMNEYRIWIEAVDSLVNHAVKTGNKRLLNLTDIIVGGGGMAGGFPGTGIGAATFLRLFQTPLFLTKTAQGLKKIGEVSIPSQIQAPVSFEAGRAIRGTTRELLEGLSE